MSIPTDWRLAQFDDVFESFQYGLTASADRTTGVEGPRFLRITDIQDHDVDWSNVPTCDAEPDAIARYKLANDDIVFARTGSIEKTWRVRNCPSDAVFASYLIRGKLRDPRLAPWMAYFLRSQAYLSQVYAAAAGVGRANVNATSISGFTLPVAPLDEQHRIVAAIDTHFSRLDAAVASLTRAKANVKRARASVLKAAVEGRLVPTEAALARAEGRNYEPATVLLDRILAERKAAWAASGARGKYKEPVKPEAEGLPQLPDGWCWASMDALLHGIEAGKSFAADNAVPSTDQVGIVKVSAVTWGTYNEDEAKTVHDPERINPDYFVRRGDLLMSRANTIELVGAAVIAERVNRRTMLSDKILRLNMPVPFRRYVLWVLRSQHGRRQIEALATGNQESMRNIGQERIKQIALPLPPLPEQHRIVAEVDRRLSVLDALDATLDANLARCARLRQAILKRAFEGRLVPAEPATQGPPPVKSVAKPSPGMAGEPRVPQEQA